jgi:hypothetical protein
MKRQGIAGIGVLLLAGSLAAFSLRPEITGVNPPAPSPSKTSQSLVVSGRDFAPGLSLSVTSPTGGVADYRGNAIAEQRETSFRVSVMLADAGTYRLVVVNPDGQTSMPFSLSAKAAADGPSVREVKPTGLRVSTSPQNLTVEGARFEAGLVVTVTDPAGGVQSLGGDAITNVMPGSFQMTVTLETAGRYELIVTNPNGKVSSSAGFDVGRAGR